MEYWSHTVTDSPSMLQIRTRFADCRAIVSFVPQELLDDGLSLEIVQAILDMYLKHRIEPEELLFTNIDSEWNSFRNHVFTLRIDGVQLTNEVELDDMGELTTVYVVWESEEEDERDTDFCRFMNKWSIYIKEKCLRDFDEFGFTVQFTRYEYEDGSRFGNATKHNIFLSEDGEWYRSEFKVDSVMTLADFTMPQRGF